MAGQPKFFVVVERTRRTDSKARSGFGPSTLKAAGAPLVKPSKEKLSGVPDLQRTAPSWPHFKAELQQTCVIYKGKLIICRAS